MKFQISLIQMDIAFGRPEENFKQVEKKIAACKDNSDIIVLPELWSTGYDLTRLAAIADKQAQNTISFLSKLASKYNVHIIGGSIANNKEKGVYNTLIVINKSGDVVHTYDKLHLFQLMDEHLYLKSGTSNGLFSLEDRNFASMICYDIRFPEWIRAHTTKGAEAIFVVAEWPKPRLAHWRSLLIARAIENQCYVIACNRVGNDPNNIFAGHSMIIDPWGEIIAEAGEKEEILTAAINLDKVTEVRKTIPIFADRKPAYYT
ncbi:MULTISPECIES: carbon-nitrogen family hydrolase [Niallia]|uniref:Carbon-nitrogen hydrolase n=1 Tax=Niallia circulans TaxID=1397 RepID=A0A268FGT7_NIACI|nr:carbon-nitrogen family hydrolase [Niallia circulans]AYV65832.1 carbon-nitrogen family hydrolase [Niallia circulans]AYV71354.1 carbon-nitrogen family hydrolase [Niallia circulans]NRG29962.1 carbon-nitrogen family hydrolase [Niallia circulans]PAD84580.1 carbon-nitrogen hydrolase [Niallia circulans]QJX61731.1 carbon-nitrogen family hydrolase [Niallia circulans]